MKVGIIAEDDSDVLVLKVITLRMLKPHVVGFKSFVGDGCGKLRRKCGTWAENLVDRGCACIIVVHDLDDYVELDLRTELENKIAEVKAKAKVVLIPKREIEAWLLYDTKAIAAAFNEKKAVKLTGSPENLPDPKRKLEALVKIAYHKTYLNTIHNPRIAEHLNLALLTKAKSFAPHPLFVKQMKQLL